jgi:hypothetical protein
LVCVEKAKGQLKTKALMLGFQDIKKMLVRIPNNTHEFGKTILKDFHLIVTIVNFNAKYWATFSKT